MSYALITEYLYEYVGKTEGVTLGSLLGRVVGLSEVLIVGLGVSLVGLVGLVGFVTRVVGSGVGCTGSTSM